MELNNPGELVARTWSGFWSGLIWFIFSFILVIVTELTAVTYLGITESVKTGVELTDERIQQLFNDGDGLSIALIILLPLIAAMLAFVVKVRRKKPYFEYLAFKKVKFKTLSLWLVSGIFLLALFELINQLLGRPIPEWILIAYQTTDNYILLFMAIVFFGPFAEEILYRGYIFRAWAESKVGPLAGGILISILWAATHLQYDLYDMTMIFVLGLLLCWSRFKSGSIYPAILIHTCWNLVAFIQVRYYLSA